MSEIRERIVRIEVDVKHIKEQVDKIVDRTEAHDGRLRDLEQSRSKGHGFAAALGLLGGWLSQFLWGK